MQLGSSSEVVIETEPGGAHALSATGDLQKDLRLFLGHLYLRGRMQVGLSGTCACIVHQGPDSGLGDGGLGLFLGPLYLRGRMQVRFCHLYRL